MSIVDVLLGRRLANRESGERKIGAFEGVPAMGLDGLGSSAYGPEAALTVLAPLGAASLGYIGWVMAPIVALLAILFASYWQTIRAYPSHGGAYTVAKDNLGTNPSLLAAAALMIDYVLNVAVGISAGVGALVSALPALHSHILPLCLGILVLITVVNLRGTLDAGRLFAIPTYLFVASFAAILGIGLYKALQSGGSPQPVVPPPALGHATDAASLWLLLRAFASGCTAMTGVEAVSNGMSAFRDPPVRYGHRTLTAIVIILGALLAGIAYLTTAYGVGAMDQTKAGYRSVLSQLASAVVGDGIFYYVAIGSLLCVLALSANTSFVDFPRLCRMIAQDGFLPKPFAVVGRRLVFSVGILYLAVSAGLLLTVFGGITDHLIPLFAIGAFMTFTLSQIGMVVHWLRAMRKKRSGRVQPAHQVHFAINAVGAATTAIALIIIISAKFSEGAWITLVVIPCVIVLLKAVRGYYDEVAAHLREPGPLDLCRTEPPIVLVALESWSEVGDKAIAFAMTLSPDVIGVHLSQLEGPDIDENIRTLQAEWKNDVEEPSRRAGLTPPRLMVLPAQYRAIHEPVLKLVEELQAKFGGRHIAVLIPELVKQRWYQTIMHTQRARRLRAQLLRHGGPSLTVIIVPWYLDEVESSAQVVRLPRAVALWRSLRACNSRELLATRLRCCQQIHETRCEPAISRCLLSPGERRKLARGCSYVESGLELKLLRQSIADSICSRLPKSIELSSQCSDLVVFRRLLSHAASHWAHLLGILMLGLLWSPMALLAPLPLKIAVDSAVGAQPLPAFFGAVLPDPVELSIGPIGIAAGLAVVLAVVGQAQGFVESLLRTYTAEHLTLRLRSSLFCHAQHLSLAYHDRTGSFDSTHRILSDAPCIQWATIYGTIPVLTAAITLTSMVYVTALIDWQLAVVALAISPAIFLLSRVHCRFVRSRWDRSRELEGATMSVVQEVLSVLRVVKAFGRERQETDRFAARSRQVIGANLRIAAINGGFDLLVGLIMALSGAAVLAMGVLHVRAGVLTLGDLLLVIGYVWQILGPVHTISNSLSSLQVAFASARRVFAILDQPADATERPGARRLRRADGAVEFRAVSFSYEGCRSALHDVSFRVEPGTRLGIVGPTGSGKTTLVNLLTRFYDPTDGAILLDGIDLRDYRLADLRNQFAIVLQEPVLFSTSIAENIAYGRPDASREEIVEAARAAKVHDFIATLPDGYGTRVGERGMSLSGGERQRISLARAFLKDAPILILDEPTSSVDMQTESAIVEVLGRLIEGRTTLIIAHRLSTLVHCDLRINLERGQLADPHGEGEQSIRVLQGLPPCDPVSVPPERATAAA